MVHLASQESILSYIYVECVCVRQTDTIISVKQLLLVKQMYFYSKVHKFNYV